MSTDDSVQPEMRVEHPGGGGKLGFAGFNLLSEEIVGFPSDRAPRHEEIVGIIGRLEEAGIPCCFVFEYALIYYGAGRVQNDRYLCVADRKYQEALNLFRTWSDVFAAVGPSPSKDTFMLLHHFPRFKLVNTTDFWVVLPSSHVLVSCESSAIEKSLGGLPYPNLKNYVESLLDTQNGADLEDLIDGMDLSQQWGQENINLDCDIPTDWARQQNAKRVEVYGRSGYSLSEEPRPRRIDWEELVRDKLARLGYKYTSVTHATRWRRHGSKDPRALKRNLI